MTSIENARAVAESNGGRVVRGPWVEPYGTRQKNTTFIEFECKNGHHFPTDLYFASRGRFRCPDCRPSNKVVDKIQKDHPTAEIIKAPWRDKTGPNNHTRITIKCGECDTIWSPLVANINRNTWCPTCKQNGPGVVLTYEMFEQFVTEKGGIICSDQTTYVNGSTPMLVSCEKDGHTSFETTFSYAKSGSWCPDCLKEKKTVPRVKQ